MNWSIKSYLFKLLYYFSLFPSISVVVFSLYPSRPLNNLLPFCIDVWHFSLTVLWMFTLHSQIHNTLTFHNTWLPVLSLRLTKPTSKNYSLDENWQKSLKKGMWTHPSDSWPKLESTSCACMRGHIFPYQQVAVVCIVISQKETRTCAAHTMLSINKYALFWKWKFLFMS